MWKGTVPLIITSKWRLEKTFTLGGFSLPSIPWPMSSPVLLWWESVSEYGNELSVEIQLGFWKVMSHNSNRVGLTLSICLTLRGCKFFQRFLIGSNFSRYWVTNASSGFQMLPLFLRIRSPLFAKVEQLFCVSHPFLENYRTPWVELSIAVCILCQFFMSFFSKTEIQSH